MNLVISSDKYYSDIAIKDLVDYLKGNNELCNNVTIYYQYPIYVDIDDQTLSPKLMVLSPYHGLIVINNDNCENEEDISKIDDDTSTLESYLFSKLIKSPMKELKKSKRELSFDLRSVLYLPTVSENCTVEIDNQIVNSKENIVKYFADNRTEHEQLSQEMIKEICSILEGSKMILKPKYREISATDTTSKGYILKKMEEQIAYFDVEQKSAALAQINGPQRIRGLAGSGKTIILCMKAALIHLREPNKKILYTFMTRSLYDYIETLIIRFYRFFGDGNLPDFDKIIVAHSWGGNNIPGAYYTACKQNGVMPITFQDAKHFGSDPFDFVCCDLLEKTQGKLKKEYDYVLIDEAQDFKPSFYQVCRSMVKNDCLVWCYDDLQNIFNVKIQDTIATFKNKYGAEGIDLSKLNEQYEDLTNDVVLAKTYRNPKEILILAHAIGFGIYNDVLIQTLENNQHWIDFGYNVLQGNCKNGDQMIIERPSENSPLVISSYQQPTEIIELKSHLSKSDEIAWLVESIYQNIHQDNVRADDIIVISLDDKNSKRDLAALSNALKSKNIHTFNITDSFYSKGFTEEGSVTLSTVYKAKGNEAAIVYVIGTEVFEVNKNRRMMRNKIFTAFTRAKGWLKISGVDMENSQLWKETNEVIANNFILKFEQTEPKYKIERDKKNKKTKENAKKKISELFSMGLSKEEIDELMAEYGGV